MTAYPVLKGGNMSWNGRNLYRLLAVRGTLGIVLGQVVLIGLIVISSVGLSAAGIESDLFRPISRDVSFMALDSVPVPVRTKSSKEPFRSASQMERARAALILKHTKLGTPPPPPEVLEQQRKERDQQSQQRKAEQQAKLADRLERRSQRMEMLRNDGSIGSKSSKRKLASQLSEERKRETQQRKTARKREKALANREAQKAKVIAQRKAEQQGKETKKARLLANRQAERQAREAKKARLVAKREADRLEQEAEKARLMAEQEADRQNKEQARLIAKREADRQEQETEKARLVAKHEAERREQEAQAANLIAKGGTELQEQKARKARLVVKQESDRRREMDLQQDEAERGPDLIVEDRVQWDRPNAVRNAKPNPPPRSEPSASPPAPQLSPEERASLQRADRQRAKHQHTLLINAQNAEAARQKRAQREARIAYREGRWERNAARKKGMREASIARIAQRQARQDALAQQRADLHAERVKRNSDRSADREQNRAINALARKERLAARDLRKSEQLSTRKSLKAARLTAQNLRKTERDLGKAEKLAARKARRNVQLAARENRKAARLNKRIARKTERDLGKAEKLAARKARRNAQLAARESRKAARLNKRIARKTERDLRKAGKLAARKARRIQRLARKELRRAKRLARRAARRAARLARREARRLRRQQNPPYWTVEPAIAVGLPARSGGASDEKGLEAITVQGLVGYHRAKGISLRGGMAATVINSKVSMKTTSSETVSQTAVVRIIQNPDGTRTEEMGTVQVPQTVIRETRYYNQLTSIDLPLLLGYRLQNNRYSLLIEAGPSLNLSSGGNAHVRDGEGFRTVSGGHFLGRRPGISFLAMLTGEYKLNETNALIGGLRLQSFGRAFENPVITSTATRVTTLSLQVGYRVRF